MNVHETVKLLEGDGARRLLEEFYGKAAVAENVEAFFWDMRRPLEIRRM